jgi:hypothetical protein
LGPNQLRCLLERLGLVHHDLDGGPDRLKACTLFCETGLILRISWHHDAPDVVTLLADEDVGAVARDDPADDDKGADWAEPDEEVADDEAVGWTDPDDPAPDAHVVAGVAAVDESDEARTADPAVRAMATPAMPAVIRLTRRRARCRRLAASLGLRTVSWLRFTLIGPGCTPTFGAPWAAGVWPL